MNLNLYVYQEDCISLWFLEQDQVKKTSLRRVSEVQSSYRRSPVLSYFCTKNWSHQNRPLKSNRSLPVYGKHFFKNFYKTFLQDFIIRKPLSLLLTHTCLQWIQFLKHTKKIFTRHKGYFLPSRFAEGSVDHLCLSSFRWGTVQTLVELWSRTSPDKFRLSRPARGLADPDDCPPSEPNSRICVWTSSESTFRWWEGECCFWWTSWRLLLFEDGGLRMSLMITGSPGDIVTLKAEQLWSYSEPDSHVWGHQIMYSLSRPLTIMCYRHNPSRASK